MKKFSKLLFLAIVALGVSFTACNNDNLPDGPDVDPKANTHVSITLKMSQGLRAAAENLPEDYNYIGEWGGQDQINTIDVYLVSGSSVSHRSYVVGTDQEYVATQNGLEVVIKPNKVSAAIKTTVGLKEVYAVVNISSEASNVLNSITNATAFKAAYENILTLENEGSASVHNTSASKLAKINSSDKDVIMMTVLNPGSINVEAGVKDTETIEGTSPKNRASVVVERAAARVMMTRADKTEFEVFDPEYQLIGEIKNVKWVAAQGNKQIYIQRKVDWVTPGHAFVSAKNADGSLTAANLTQYDYSGLFEGYVAAPKYGGTQVATYADYANTKTDANAEQIVLNSLQGKFILPVTHEYANAPVGDAEYTGGYKKGNTSYVMVRTTFTPEVIYSVKGDTGDDRFENVAGSYTEDSDFIVGSDGKFYSSEQAAYNATKNLKMTKYVGGKVLYYAWLNPDIVEAPYNSPSLRNNIYHIHITGFKNLGTNWNTLFPEDPNDPNYPKDPVDGGNPDPKPEYEKVIDPEEPDTPKEPEEPNPPIDPEDPLTTKETYMSVDVKVLPWKVHSYQVDLGI